MNKNDTILYFFLELAVFCHICVEVSGISGAGVMLPSVPRQQSKKHELKNVSKSA